MYSTVFLNASNGKKRDREAIIDEIADSQESTPEPPRKRISGKTSGGVPVIQRSATVRTMPNAVVDGAALGDNEPSRDLAANMSTMSNATDADSILLPPLTKDDFVPRKYRPLPGGLLAPEPYSDDLSSPVESAQFNMEPSSPGVQIEVEAMSVREQIMQQLAKVTDVPPANSKVRETLVRRRELYEQLGRDYTELKERSHDRQKDDYTRGQGDENVDADMARTGRLFLGTVQKLIQTDTDTETLLREELHMKDEKICELEEQLHELRQHNPQSAEVEKLRGSPKAVEAQLDQALLARDNACRESMQRLKSESALKMAELHRLCEVVWGGSLLKIRRSNIELTIQVVCLKWLLRTRTHRLQLDQRRFEAMSDAAGETIRMRERILLLEQNVSDKDLETRNLKSKNHELAQQLSQAAIEKQNYLIEKQRLEQALSDESEKYQSKLADNVWLNQLYDDSEKRYQVCHQEKERLEQSLSKKQVEQQSQSADNDWLVGLLEDAEKRYQECRHEKEILEQSLSRKQEEQQSQSADNDWLVGLLEDAENRYQECRHRKERLEQSLSKRQEEQQSQSADNDWLVGLVEDTEKRYQECRHEKETLEQSLSDREDEQRTLLAENKRLGQFYIDTKKQSQDCLRQKHRLLQSLSKRDEEQRLSLAKLERLNTIYADIRTKHQHSLQQTRKLDEDLSKAADRNAGLETRLAAVQEKTHGFTGTVLKLRGASQRIAAGLGVVINQLAIKLQREQSRTQSLEVIINQSATRLQREQGKTQTLKAITAWGFHCLRTQTRTLSTITSARQELETKLEQVEADLQTTISKTANLRWRLLFLHQRRSAAMRSNLSSKLSLAEHRAYLDAQGLVVILDSPEKYTKFFQPFLRPDPIAPIWLGGGIGAEFLECECLNLRTSETARIKYVAFADKSRIWELSGEVMAARRIEDIYIEMELFRIRVWHEGDVWELDAHGTDVFDGWWDAVQLGN